jgi:hypothetical protein
MAKLPPSSGCHSTEYHDMYLSAVKTSSLTSGYSLSDQRKNENILEELGADPVQKSLAQYKQKYLNHVSRMEDVTYPKQLLDYRTIGRGRRRRRRRRRPG